MKTNRNKVRLTESQLHRVIKEAVNKIMIEYKNDFTHQYNDSVDDLLSQGYDIATAKKKARDIAQQKGEHKNYLRHYGDYNPTEDDLATNRAISNFMDGKDAEWWQQGKNKIVPTHRTDDDGNEWNEDFVESYPCTYKPSHEVFKKYMKKHNRPLDTRYGIERNQ